MMMSGEVRRSYLKCFIMKFIQRREERIVDVFRSFLNPTELDCRMLSLIHDRMTIDRITCGGACHYGVLSIFFLPFFCQTKQCRH